MTLFIPYWLLAIAGVIALAILFFFAYIGVCCVIAFWGGLYK